MGNNASATHANSVALGAGSQTTVGAEAGYAAAYVGQSQSTGEVAVGGRKVTGVAPGSAGTDAVNVDQLNAGISAANRYSADLAGELRRDTYAAVASALAVKQAPWVAGKTTYYAGVGGYKSQAALGISLRRTADSGRWSLEGGFSADRNGGGAYVGVSGVIGD